MSNMKMVVPERYKKTKIGIIPVDWDVVFASEILERYSLPVQLENDRSYREIGIRSHGKGIFHKGETTAKDIGNKRVFWLKPNTLVLNIVFAWERAVAIASENEKGFIASHRFPMYEAKDNCNLSFLLRYFLNPRGNFELQLASPGGAGRNRTLGQEAFQKVRVPLPPLPEQERIATILNTWDEAISKQAELIALKEKRKRGLMQKLLTGEKRFPKFVKESGFKKTRAGLIPKDWSILRMDSFSIIKRSKYYPIGCLFFSCILCSFLINFYTQKIIDE